MTKEERNKLISAKIKSFTKMMVSRGPDDCREYLETLNAPVGGTGLGPSKPNDEVRLLSGAPHTLL